MFGFRKKTCKTNFPLYTFYVSVFYNSKTEQDITVISVIVK